MNLIFTCGGTAGHINPAIAVANMMRERHPDCNILFIGAKGHMEEKLVPQAGYDLKCLEGSGLSRGKNLVAVKKNLHAVKCVREGVKACKKIFQEFKPDVVIGTGAVRRPVHGHSHLRPREQRRPRRHHPYGGEQGQPGAGGL